jgi:hypothetical protein
MTMRNRNTGWVALTLAGLAACAAGCGGAAVPTHARTDAVAAVRSAETIGAASTPAAAYQLELARGELERADALIHQGQIDEARRLLERAKVDADLAVALRREDTTRATAIEAHQQIDQMRDAELGTSGGVANPSTPASPAPESTTTTTTTTTTGGAQ